MVKRYIASWQPFFSTEVTLWDSFIPSLNLLGTKLLELCCISDEDLHGGDENLVLLVV